MSLVEQMTDTTSLAYVWLTGSATAKREEEKETIRKDLMSKEMKLCPASLVSLRQRAVIVAPLYEVVLVMHETRLEAAPCWR